MRRAPTRGGGGRISPSWVASFPSGATVVNAASKVLLGSFVLDGSFAETVLRVRGRLLVYSDSATVVENQLGAFGMIVVTDVAFAAGLASVPGPATDAADDNWFVYVPFSQRGHDDIAGGDKGSAQGYDYDSKAMRIVEEGSVIALVVENHHAAHGLIVHNSVRLLAKLTQR